MDSTDDDDLFATLGGSLMKDLLADLNDDADASFLSLEQLEKELAHLDSKPPFGSLPTVTEEAPSAASMVVAAQQQQHGRGGSLYGDSVITGDGSAVDAWSLSLQKFTAASLEEDFLQADSARKALTGAPPTPTTPKAPPGLEQLLSKAEEYDVKEKLLVRPPPGLGSSQAATTPSQQAPSTPQQPSVMEQVAQKLAGFPQGSLAEATPPIPRPMPATPQNSMALDLPSKDTAALVGSSAATSESVVAMPPPPVAPEGPPPPTAPGMQSPVPPGHYHQHPIPPTPPNSVHVTPHAGMPPPMAPLTAVPVAMPLPQAWQGSPMMAPPPPPQRPVYANPHPDAPPIPAHALATPFMTVRDISYVVHSILKPILALGTSPFDYDQVYWRRRGQGLRPGKKASQPDKLEKEMKSRSEKAAEWSNQHSTLGKSAKANVARPRALIAQPVEGTSSGGEEKQRQTLWKARIYCDQAYQAYMQVVEAWESSPGTAVPANLQPHLVKLLRCLGISLKDSSNSSGDDKEQNNKPSYTIDPAALSLLLKLTKGRVLLARLLEQALLPPASVQVLLPQALRVLYDTTKPDPVDERVFAAWARVINSLPDLTGTCISQATQAILDNPTVALSSTSRMQAVHGLLRRGSLLAASDNAGFGQEWSRTESEFMKILGGV